MIFHKFLHFNFEPPQRLWSHGFVNNLNKVLFIHSQRELNKILTFVSLTQEVLSKVFQISKLAVQVWGVIVFVVLFWQVQVNNLIWNETGFLTIQQLANPLNGLTELTTPLVQRSQPSALSHLLSNLSQNRHSHHHYPQDHSNDSTILPPLIKRPHHTRNWFCASIPPLCPSIAPGVAFTCLGWYCHLDMSVYMFYLLVKLFKFWTFIYWTILCLILL